MRISYAVFCLIKKNKPFTTSSELFKLCRLCCFVLTDCPVFFFFNDTATTEISPYGHPLALHDAIPIYFPVRFREVDAACANPLLAIPQSMICDFEIQVGNLGRETRCRENLGCEQPGLYTAAEIFKIGRAHV